MWICKNYQESQVHLYFRFRHSIYYINVSLQNFNIQFFVITAYIAQ